MMSPWAVDANGNELVGTKFFLPGKLKYPNGAWAINKTSTPNPLSEIANSYQTEKIWQALGNIFFQYQPAKWISLKTTFSTGFSTNQLGISNSAETNAGVLVNNKNSASITKSDNFNYTWDNQIDMKHTFGESHDFSLLLLQSMF
ncbi:SusC/RagA family TonB-linked outer membrane protein, partial [Epilithonimonas ginsengisoli]|nr:SusC/RagA family TonB-linked outer membrane protein [Epilithonimonas ginsengisoli]